MTNYPNITISLYDPYPIKVLNIKQYDTGRGAMVTLTGLGGDVITPTGNGLYVYAKKRDGNIIYNTVTLVGSQVQIDFDEQMTVISGLLQVEIQMIDPEGKTISTPIFAVNVMPSNINTLQIESTSEFGALTDVLAEVENLKQNGLKGNPGKTATIQVGTVTASEPGGNPAVTNSGTENAAVLNFTLPRGEPGSMWYQGDAITGTSTSGTVFSGSGIASAEVNDMYLNTGSGADKGNVYVCVLAGDASTAQWAYKQNIMGPTGPAGTANAASVAYDNESSGLTADNVQEAVDELNQKFPNNAGSHNGIYRGKNLGSSVTESQWQAISSGTFEDLYIGDYWIINGVNWRIAAFDYYLNCGDTNFTQHHVVIVPDTCLYNAQMNTTNVTTGAYKGSAMYTANLAQAKSTINSAFGSSHVLSHRIYLSNATSNGRASAGEWTDSTVDLMCEHMVYGSGIFSPVSDGSNVPNNYRVEKGQLPLFALEPSRICNRVTWWLRDVISDALFAYVSSDGNANNVTASFSLGVRPAFCIG